MKCKHTNPTHCPVTATIQLIGGKYKTLILWNITNGINRFGLLKKNISNITAKMLTQQLRELEKDKLISRKIYPVIPPKVEYQLTEFGKSINDIMMSMYKWGYKYLTKQGIKVDCQMYKI